ncbi:MAG: acyl carrier protein [Erysipelotrichaceae bacterium]|nr:acyl carrier protein [Erysipelotrichaceae bacterium]
MKFRDEVIGLVVDKVAELRNIEDKTTLTEETNLKDGLSFKSGELVVVIGALEDEYDVYIDFMKLAKCETIGSIADFVVRAVMG